MPAMTDGTQEDSAPPRTEPVGAKVSKADKAAIEAVRDHTGTPVAVLMFEHSINDLIAWGRRLLAAP